MNPDLIPWIVLFAPLLAALSITLFTRNHRSISAALSVSAVVLGFLLSAIFIGWAGWSPIKPESALNWMQVGTLNIEFGLRFDPLSLLMMLVVTGVASAIHIYSIGYMHEDRALPRFFACLSLFTFSIIILQQFF